jgi:tetratricopeptide (TPR) repeat protein
MTTTQQVAQAITTFLNSGDLLESKQLVKQYALIFFSDAADDYFRALFETYRDDANTLALLTTKRDWLMSCRQDGIDLAFARLFLEMFPDPVSDTALRTLISATNEQDIQRLVTLQPDLLGEFQRVTVGAQLLQALLAEAQNADRSYDRSTRITIYRTALRLVDRRIDLETWAAINGELANALSTTPATEADLDESIALYRQALAVYESTATSELIGNALHNLGNALVNRINGDRNQNAADGLAYLRRALAIRDRATQPYLWAQTQCSIGHALMIDPVDAHTDRLEQAIDCFTQALEVLTVKQTPELWIYATRDLAETYRKRATGSRFDNLTQAVDLYQNIIVYGRAYLLDTELANMQERLTQASVALARESGRRDPNARSTTVVDDSEEGFVVQFDQRSWVLARSQSTLIMTIEEWLVDGSSVSTWEELITTDSWWGAHKLPFSGTLEAKRQSLQAKVLNGSFAWNVLHESSDEALYEWAISDDLAIEDQFELVRMIRGNSGLHLIHYAARGRLIEPVRDEWLARLKDAQIGMRRRIVPQATAPVSQSELDYLIEQLQADPPPTGIAHALDFYRSVRAQVDGVDNPALKAAIGFLAALYLLRTPHRSSEHIEVAIQALRRSLETYQREANPDLWTRSIHQLAHAFSIRTAGDHEQNLRQAAWGLETIIEVLASKGPSDDLIGVLHDYGNVCVELGTVAEPQRLPQAIEVFKTALEICPPDTRPEMWAELMLSLGDAYVQLSVSQEEAGYNQQAEEAYSKVIARFASDTNFRQVEVDHLGLLMGQAIMRLNQMDREGVPEPRVPAGFKDRETRGKVLYLRPLLSSGQLLYPNRFKDPASFVVQFDVEPETFTIEAALYRVLGPSLGFYTLGGRVEGFGGTRLFVLGGEGWQDAVKTQFATADLVIMLPHDSPGVKWEIEFLMSQQALPKCLFVMPPISPVYDVPDLWDGAVKIMRDSGLNAPPFNEQGSLFCLNAAGSVEESFPFEAIWDNTLFERIEHLLPRRT